MVICSAGIALALLGSSCSTTRPGTRRRPPVGAGLGRPDRCRAAPRPRCDPLAVVLLLLGFGTKAGLAPLHAWLPDAHSQAPAPVSALMSGVLLSVAFYAILRFKVIADTALGPDFVRGCCWCWRWPRSRRRVAAAGPARLQTDAGLLQHRTHGPARAGRRGIGSPLPSPRCCCTSSVTAWSRACCSWAPGGCCRLTGTSRIDQVRGLAAPATGAGRLSRVRRPGPDRAPAVQLFASELGIVRAGFAGGWAGRPPRR